MDVCVCIPFSASQVKTVYSKQPARVIRKEGAVPSGLEQASSILDGLRDLKATNTFSHSGAPHVHLEKGMVVFCPYPLLSFSP